jgi:ABC-type polysaccharide/polyol phosphate export permease
MAGIMTLYRAALLNHPLPEAAWLAESLIMALAIGWFGVVVFQRLQARFADEL